MVEDFDPVSLLAVLLFVSDRDELFLVSLVSVVDMIPTIAYDTLLGYITTRKYGNSGSTEHHP